MDQVWFVAAALLLLRHLQTDILGKVNVVLALDKDDPSKEDSVKAVSSSSVVLKQQRQCVTAAAAAAAAVQQQRGCSCR
jgi:hypothetical protein